MKFDVIIIGGDRCDAAEGLRYIKEGKSVCLIAEGGHLDSPEDRLAFAHKGGTLLLGDSVARVEWTEDGSVARLFTVNLGGTPLEAPLYILASGRFFTKGLCSDMDKVWEPVFGVDVRFGEDPSKWCSEDFFAPQPFESFGVIADSEGHALKDGRPVSNLIACGSILAGPEK